MIIPWYWWLIFGLPVLFVAIGLLSAWISNLAHARAERQANRWRWIAAQQVEHFDCKCALEPAPIITHERNRTSDGRGELHRRVSREEHAEKWLDENDFQEEHTK